MGSNTHSWSRLFQARTSVRRRFPSIWHLPIRKRYHVVLQDQVPAAGSVLEIGAYDRHLRQRLNSLNRELNYFSVDSDDSFDHDFSDINEVTGQYDLIIGLEVIEHLALPEATAMLEKAVSLLNPGGVLVLTTPNIYYPAAFFKDATHVTAIAYDELGGLAELAGLQVEHLYRLYHDPLLQRILRRYIAYPLFRLIKQDFAEQIMLVAKKTAP